MNSAQITRTKKTANYPCIAGPNGDGFEVVCFWLREIALQLAISNERAADALTPCDSHSPDTAVPCSLSTGHRGPHRWYTEKGIERQ